MLWVLLLHSNKGTGSQVSHMRSVPALRSWVLNTCSHPQNGFRVLHATFRFPCLGSKNLSLSWVPGLRSQVPPRVSGLEFYFLKMLNNDAFRKNYLRKNVGFFYEKQPWNLLSILFCIIILSYCAVKICMLFTL